MLLNKQAVKQAVRETGKRCSKEFVEGLDRKVSELIKRAAEKTRLSTLTAAELL